MCAALSPLQICPFSGGKFHSPSRAIPCPKSLPLQARQGLLFPFCLFRCPSVPSLPPAWMGWLFLIPVCRCPRIRSQLAHTGPTGPVTRFAGVRFPLLGPQNRTQGHTGASLDFLPRTSLPLPLKGEGRGIVFLGLALLVHSWATLAQQGLFGASLVSFPYPAHKIAHRLSQGRVWFLPSFSPTFSHR